MSGRLIDIGSVQRDLVRRSVQAKLDCLDGFTTVVVVLEQDQCALRCATCFSAFSGSSGRAQGRQVATNAS